MSWPRFPHPHHHGTLLLTREPPSIYTCFLGAGVGGGILVCGLVSIGLHWRYCYWIAVALIGTATILIILTFPETEYDRSAAGASDADSIKEVEFRKGSGAGFAVESRLEHAPTASTTGGNRPDVPHQKRSFVRDLRVFSGVHTRESLWKLFWRPVVLLTLPPILWATLVMAVTIGFLVAITSNFASAFSTAYGFQPWQSGLCFISSILGSLIGIFFGGNFSDWIADWLTRRNGGVREPEMRLPAMMISVVTAPLSLVLYGEGIGLQLHWMCATIGLGLRKFRPLSASLIPDRRTRRVFRREHGSADLIPCRSQLLHRPGHQRQPRLHHRRLPPRRRRGHRHPVRLQVYVVSSPPFSVDPGT